jgi:hypothetical protein
MRMNFFFLVVEQLFVLNGKPGELDVKFMKQFLSLSVHKEPVQKI